VAVDLTAEAAGSLAALLSRVIGDFDRIVAVYDEAPSLQDRTATTGIVKPELVARFAAGGPVGRASGRACDTRVVYPYAPYDELVLTPALRHEGDVNARLWIRVDEVHSSVDLIRQLLALLEPGPLVAAAPRARQAQACAMVESFRGDVFVSVTLAEAHGVAEIHLRDPSVFQWPLLEAAIEGNIVADFPLCNKSFNCSYAGHDL
jgi:Ni,Fe-hydrogenase III large subunit